MPAGNRENPLLKTGNSDAFFREKCLTKNKKGKVVDRGKVLALHKAGWSQAKIADEMGCHPSRISQILKEER